MTQEQKNKIELSEEEIGGIASKFLDRILDLRKRGETGEEAEKLFDKIYGACLNKDEILLEVGAEVVELLKEKNLEEEGGMDVVMEQAMQEAVGGKLGNFDIKLPHGVEREFFSEGGKGLEELRKQGLVSGLGFVMGGHFFDDMWRRSLWRDMDETAKDNGIPLEEIAGDIGKREKSSTLKSAIEGLDLSDPDKIMGYFRNPDSRIDDGFEDMKKKKGSQATPDQTYSNMSNLYVALRSEGYSKEYLTR